MPALARASTKELSALAVHFTFLALDIIISEHVCVRMSTMMLYTYTHTHTQTKNGAHFLAGARRRLICEKIKAAAVKMTMINRIIILWLRRHAGARACAHLRHARILTRVV